MLSKAQTLLISLHWLGLAGYSISDARLVLVARTGSRVAQVPDIFGPVGYCSKVIHYETPTDEWRSIIFRVNIES